MTLVSQRPGVPSDLAFDAGFEGSSKDGTRVFFVTDEKLDAGDRRGQPGRHLRAVSAPTVTKISPGNAAWNARFQLASDDGSVVLFDTSEKLHVSDDDDTRDVYRVIGGTPTLISPGANSGETNVCKFVSSRTPRGCGILMSTDGRVFFHTDAKLLPADTDAMFDIYEWSGGALSMLPSSSGKPNALLDISDNGDLVFFESQAELAAGDTDGNFLDVYQARFVQPQVVTPPGTGTGTPPPATSSGTPNLTVKLSARKTQRILSQGGVVVSFVCNNACQGSATGSINVPGASKVFRLGKATKSAKANKTTTLKLKLAKKARSAIKRALKRGKSLRAKVKLTVKDGSGSKTSSLTVRLKR